MNPPLPTPKHVSQDPSPKEQVQQTNGFPHAPSDPIVTHNPVPATANAHCHYPHTLTIVSANVPGLWTHKADVTSLIHNHRPHIMVLVDVRLHKKQKNSKWVKTLLRGYKYWASTAQEEGRGVRGVIVAVNEHLAILGKIHALDCETDGRIQSIVLTLPHSSPLAINGVYGPAGTTPADEDSRSQMYSRLTQLGMNSLRIDAGDWNAVLSDGDRSSGALYPKDLAHQAYVEENKLMPLAPHTNRPHTYRHGNVADGSLQTSRIDDILSNHPLPANITVLDNGQLSDHSPLLAHIDMTNTMILIPTERQPITKNSKRLSLITPVNEKEKILLADTIDSEREGQSSQIQSLNYDLDNIIASHIQPFNTSLKAMDGKSSHRLLTIDDRPSCEVVNLVAERYNQIIQESRSIALRICKTKATQPGGGHHRTRAEKKQREKLRHALKMARALQKEAKVNGFEDQDMIQNMIRNSTLPISPEDRDRWVETLEAQHTSANDGNSSCLAGLPTLQVNERLARKALQEWDKKEYKENFQENINRNRQLLYSKPKLANKRMNSTGDYDDYPALTDETNGRTTDDPNEWVSMLESYFKKKQAPPSGRKTGKYSPQDAPRNYPWASGLDTFQLETGASNLERRTWLHDRIMDPTLFNECMNSLKHNKSPGPDGVENEILQMLPCSLQQCLHKLFIIMWTTGVTPTSWKTSHTCLLNKEKGDQTLIKNRRPIGLLNSTYKLWTKLTTRVLYDYAMQHLILSTSQKGFCKFANTMEQVQLLIMAFEDAWLTGQNIFN